LIWTFPPPLEREQPANNESGGCPITASPAQPPLRPPSKRGRPLPFPPFGEGQEMHHDCRRHSDIERLHAAAAGDRHNLVAIGESGGIEAGFLIPKDQRDRAAGPPVSYGPPSESGTDDAVGRAKLAESRGEGRAEYLEVFKPSFRHAIAGIGR